MMEHLAIVGCGLWWVYLIGGGAITLIAFISWYDPETPPPPGIKSFALAYCPVGFVALCYYVGKLVCR
jgi:hypothetical protein